MKGTWTMFLSFMNVPIFFSRVVLRASRGNLDVTASFWWVQLKSKHSSVTKLWLWRFSLHILLIFTKKSNDAGSMIYPNDLFHLYSRYRTSIIMNRISNGTGQCNFFGQRDRSSLVILGQRTTGLAQNLAKGKDETRQAVKIQDRIWDGTVQDFDCLSWDFTPALVLGKLLCPRTKGQWDIPPQFVLGLSVEMLIITKRN